jgi:hypothetical protein
MAAVETPQVAASAGETDPEWGASGDHVWGAFWGSAVGRPVRPRVVAAADDQLDGLRKTVKTDARATRK